jgi:hypothetical protein
LNGEEKMKLEKEAGGKGNKEFAMMGAGRVNISV